MSVIKRVGRLVKADIHGILDCLEEPESIARQAVREMREEIERCEQEMEAAAARSRKTKRAIEQIMEKLQGFEEQLELCFAAGDEKLARAILRRRIEHERSRAELEEAYRRSRQEVEARDRQLSDYRQRLQSIEQKLELLLQTEHAREESSGDCVYRDSRCAVSDEEVEIAFLREKQRRSAAAEQTSEAAS